MKVSSKKPNKDVEKYTNLIGFIILLSLAALITVNDIVKLFKNKYCMIKNFALNIVSLQFPEKVAVGTTTLTKKSD